MELKLFVLNFLILDDCWDPCKSVNCLNGGTCKAKEGSSSIAECVCPEGFRGDRCEVSHCDYNNECVNVSFLN